MFCMNLTDQAEYVTLLLHTPKLAFFSSSTLPKLVGQCSVLGIDFSPPPAQQINPYGLTVSQSPCSICPGYLWQERIEQRVSLNKMQILTFFSNQSSTVVGGIVLGEAGFQLATSSSGKLLLTSDSWQPWLNVSCMCLEELRFIHTNTSCCQFVHKSTLLNLNVCTSVTFNMLTASWLITTARQEIQISTTSPEILVPNPMASPTYIQVLNSVTHRFCLVRGIKKCKREKETATNTCNICDQQHLQTIQI